MFADSLPSIFTFTELFGPFEFFTFLLIIAIALWISTPEVDITWEDQNEKTSFRLFLHACWLGYAPLWKVFWPFFILVNGFLLRVDFLTAASRYTIPSWDTSHFILVLPIVWWGVSIWRCSANTSIKIWSWAARFIGLCLIVELLLRMLLRVYYPQVIFDCAELLKVYGECF